MAFPRICRTVVVNLLLLTVGLSIAFVWVSVVSYSSKMVTSRESLFKMAIQPHGAEEYLHNIDRGLEEHLEPSDDWLDTKEALLAEKSRLKKVLLFTYMRGGSTIFSELFNLPGTSDVLWYEPLDTFYTYYFGVGVFNMPLSVLYHQNFTRRLPSTDEKEAFTRYLDQVLACDVDALPPETLTQTFYLERATAFQHIHDCMPRSRRERADLMMCNNGLKPYCANSKKYVKHNGHIPFMTEDCHKLAMALHNRSSTTGQSSADFRLPTMKELKRAANRSLTPNEYELLLEHDACMEPKRSKVRSCIKPVLKTACSKASLVSAKVIRASMADLNPLIDRIPDLRIVFLVRDPRAIAASRVKNIKYGMMFSNTDFTAAAEAKGLCKRMQDDIDAKKEIDVRYPGVILTVRYEDFVTDPNRIVDKVYEHVRHPLPKIIYEHLHSLMNGEKDTHGHQRANAKKLIDRWRTKSTAAEAAVMNEHCLSVLKHYNYTLL